MQKDILDLLKGFKSLRLNSLEKYLNHRYGTTKNQFESMISQLKTLGKIEVKKDIAILTYREIDYLNVRAFDISVGLSDGSAENIKKGREPICMQFTIENGGETTDNMFGIVNVKQGGENNIVFELQNALPYLAVIFIIQNLEQRELLKITNESYFALETEIGQYRYFKNN